MKTNELKKLFSAYETQEKDLCESAKELLKEAVKDHKFTWSKREIDYGECPQIRAEYYEDAAWIRVISVELDESEGLIIVGTKGVPGSFGEYDCEELEQMFFDTICYLTILGEILKKMPKE